MEASKACSGANSKKRCTSNKWHWTGEEDKLLTELVRRYGPGNWSYIANHIRGRTGMSCRLRWVNHLNPKVDKTPFSEEEQGRLLELHRVLGNKWSTIVGFFPGRTDNQLKNRYHALVGSRDRKVSSPSSSSTDRRGCLITGSTDLSRYVSLSTVAADPQLPDVPCQGNSSSGRARCLTSMLDKREMPFFPGGSSSIYGSDETWYAACFSNPSRRGPNSFDSVYPGNTCANLRTSQGGCRISDARSAAISELCPVAQSQEGVNVKDCQFIDFLGVGNSE